MNEQIKDVIGDRQEKQHDNHYSAHSQARTAQAERDRERTLGLLAILLSAISHGRVAALASWANS